MAEVYDALLSNENFQFYLDHFNRAVDAGREASNAILAGIPFAVAVVTSTYDRKENVEGLKNDLINDLQGSYNTLNQYANDVTIPRESVLGLTEHLNRKAGKTLDQHLSDTSTTVSPLLNSVYSSYGVNISSNNVQ